MSKENDLYRVLFESSDDAILLIEGEQFVECNASALALFGCERDDLIGKTPLTFSPPTQPDGRTSAEAVQERVGAALSGEPQRFEWLHQRLDGEPFYVRVSLHRVDAGESTLLQVSLHDITDNKQAEQALQDARERQQIVLETAPTAILVTSLSEGVVKYANHEFSTMSGYQVDEILGQLSPNLYYHSQDRARLLSQVQAQGTVHGFEMQGKHKDGSPIWVLLSAEPIQYDNEPALLTSFIDISERKRLEQAVQDSLVRRERQVEITTQVAQQIAAAPALDILFDQVVTLVKERFGYYHAQLFRYDPERDLMALVAGYGQAGQDMLAHQHSLTIGTGVVGMAAATGESVLVPDVRVDEYWQPNPGLPDTQGELAVPIKWQDQVLGILDVQSDRAGALTGEDQLLLESLCGQIAIAIENRRLLADADNQHRMLQAVLDNIPTAVFVADVSTGQPVLANNHAEQLLGKGIAPDATSDELAEVYDAYVYGTDELYPANRMPLVRGMLGESSVVEDMEIRRPDGERILLQVSGAPIKDETGKISASVAVFQDITEQRQIRERIEAEVAERTTAFLESQQMLQLIMDNIPQSIFWKDRDLIYLGCNRNFAEDAGKNSPDEIVGKTDFDMPWGTQAELYRADDSQVMESGIAKMDFEEPQDAPDGGQTWLRTNKVPLRDEDGNVWAVLGMYEDITARKQVEQALRDSEARYSILVEQAKDGVLLIQDNILTFVNQALAGMLGYASPAEMEGTPFIQHVAPASKGLIADRVRRRLSGEDVPAVYEAQLQCQDGTVKDVEVSGAVIEYGGKQTNVGLIRDITGRKQADEERERLIERRMQQARVSARVSQELADVPRLEELFQRVVALAKEQLGYYHAQIFRHDADQDRMVVVAGYGEAGAAMVAAGHSLAMGTGVVGTAATTGKSVLAP
ncbi:MAG: PAS domain S-box protein, partial [Anaerolineae bacterium]|nr:PAS domain S-box protein [Anaerolineae bacterium]